LAAENDSVRVDRGADVRAEGDFITDTGDAHHLLRLHEFPQELSMRTKIVDEKNKLSFRAKREPALSEAEGNLLS